MPEPHKQPRSSLRRFEAAQLNETWQLDFTHWHLGTDQDVEILNFLDDHSRLLLGCTAHTRVTGPIVVEEFLSCTAIYGIPASTLTDNGMVYTTRFSRGKEGRNAFEHTRHILGVKQKNGSPSHPQIQGKIDATSSAQLVAAYPSSGGTYFYGRERLGPWPGYLAGWGFVIGKTASAAAMAMTFAAYAAPAGWERPVAIAAVVVLAAVNYHGVSRTAGLTRILVIGVLLALGIAVAACWGGSAPDFGRILGDGLLAHGWYGILQSAGPLFFAFAGYARIATMGEEVRNPGRTIPRAIMIALAITVVIYALIALTLLA